MLWFSKTFTFSLKVPGETREMTSLSLLFLLLALGACDDVKYISKRNSGRRNSLCVYCLRAHPQLCRFVENETFCPRKSFLEHNDYATHCFLLTLNQNVFSHYMMHWHLLPWHNGICSSTLLFLSFSPSPLYLSLIPLLSKLHNRSQIAVLLFPCISFFLLRVCKDQPSDCLTAAVIVAAV